MLSFLFKSLVGRVFSVAVVVGAAVVGWILISPLFIDRTVNEQLPLLAQPTTQAPQSGPESGPESGTESGPVGSAVSSAVGSVGGSSGEGQDIAAVADSPSTSTPSSTPTPLLVGAFSDADRAHQGSGNVALFELPNWERVLRFEDFRVTNGPDLFVWLTNVEDPKLDKKQIGEDGNWVNLGRLKGNVGDQNYAIPQDVNLDEYKHVVIWCKAFGVLFSAATLGPSS